jgi:hypothetical protein
LVLWLLIILHGTGKGWTALLLGGIELSWTIPSRTGLPHFFWSYLWLFAWGHSSLSHWYPFGSYPLSEQLTLLCMTATERRKDKKFYSAELDVDTGAYLI